MDKHDIETLRSKVSCASVLDSAGFAVDAKESTRRAIKYRRGDRQIVIIIHDGYGWFDPLSDAKGDVFSLAMHLGAADFPSALREVGELVGYVPTQLVWKSPVPAMAIASIASRWSARRKLAPGSPSWTYMTRDRRLPDEVVHAAAALGLVREGPYGGMWAKHVDAAGSIKGWEERGPNWRGFSTGGRKTLFRFGTGLRFCVTEAAIDALSLAALERLRADTCYVSTGGGWSPGTTDAFKSLFALPGATVLAATDDDEQGDIYASRLEAIAGEVGLPCSRLRPPHGDWNDSLMVSRG